MHVCQDRQKTGGLGVYRLYDRAERMCVCQERQKGVD